MSISIPIFYKFEIKKSPIHAIIQSAVYKNLHEVSLHLRKFFRHLCKNATEIKGFPIQNNLTSQFFLNVQVFHGIGIHSNLIFLFWIFSFYEFSSHHIQISLIRIYKLYIIWLRNCFSHGFHPIFFNLISFSLRIIFKFLSPWEISPCTEMPVSIFRSSIFQCSILATFK